MDESMNDDSDGNLNSSSEEFDKVVSNVEMLIDRELYNTWWGMKCNLLTLKLGWDYKWKHLLYQIYSFTDDIVRLWIIAYVSSSEFIYVEMLIWIIMT